MCSRGSVLQAALIPMRADFPSLVQTRGVGRQVRVPICVKRTLAKCGKGRVIPDEWDVESPTLVQDGNFVSTRQKGKKA